MTRAKYLGYEVNMRQDRRTGECLAFIPHAYKNHAGVRYYMALTLLDGWCEVTPQYATRNTRTTTKYPSDLKRAIDRQQGYLLNVIPKLLG